VTRPDMSVAIGGASLANPVMTASGCAGSGREVEAFVDLAALGALVTRSISLDPEHDTAPPQVVETPSGLLTDAGPRPPGLQTFLATELPWLAQRRVRTVVSLAADDLGAWAEVSRRVATSPGVGGVEVNLAWPPGSRAARDSYQAGKIIAAVRPDLPRGVPLLAKVAADVHAVVDVARAVTKAGADAVVVGHGQPGMVLDPVSLRPGPSEGAGSLGGPAVHAVALRCVWEVRRALPEVPLVGCGGVRSGRDALSMLVAGASAVQVGTAMLHDPYAPARILTELETELVTRGIDSVAEVLGRAHDEPGGLS
jgi:dihydroorotate dehydrogenase (NAD+) catalytic subunit